MSFVTPLVVSEFKNVFDVLAFLVHHFEKGFQTVEEREHALSIVESANPLTNNRTAERDARIEAERAVSGAAVVHTQVVSGYTQEDLNSAAEKAAQAAVAAYIASTKTENVSAPSDQFSVTPDFVPENNPAG